MSWTGLLPNGMMQYGCWTFFEKIFKILCLILRLQSWMKQYMILWRIAIDWNASFWISGLKLIWMMFFGLLKIIVLLK